MGTWGPGIADDDVAGDVQAEYLERLYAGADDTQASDEAIATFGPIDGDDDTVVFWLALADVQHAWGRLTERARDEALAIINDGRGLERWHGDKKRAAALLALRKRLLGEPKARKKLTRRAREPKPGDVFRLRLPGGRYAFGQAVTEGERAFFAFTSDERRPPMEAITTSPVVFVQGSTDDGFGRRQWHIIGHEPIAKTVPRPTLLAHQPVGSATCTVYDVFDREAEQRRPVVECLDIEVWGAWSALHCIDRLVAAAEGRESMYVQRVRLDR